MTSDDPAISDLCATLTFTMAMRKVQPVPSFWKLQAEVDARQAREEDNTQNIRLSLWLHISL